MPIETILVETSTHKVIVNDENKFDLIECAQQGPPGVNGVDGIDGTGGDKAYTHTESPAASVWNVEHGLNKYPSVSVVDSAGTHVVGDLEYVDSNNLTITFASAFSGKAYIN